MARVRVKPSKSSAAAPNPLLQAADVFAMRNRGQSWEKIALTLSITPEEAKKTFQEVLRNNVVTNLEEYIEAELSHLYELTENVMPHVLMGSIDHFKIALQLVDARMRLLGASVASGRLGAGEIPPGGHTGTVIELTAGGDEDQYVKAMEAAKQAVDAQKPG